MIFFNTKNGFMVSLGGPTFVGAERHMMDTGQYGITFFFQRRSHNSERSFHSAKDFAEMCSGVLGDKEFVDDVLREIVNGMVSTEPSYLII